MAVADLVHELSEDSQRDLVLTQELYTLAARQPAYRELTHVVDAPQPGPPGEALRPGHGPPARRPHPRWTAPWPGSRPHGRALTLEAIARITTTDRHAGGDIPQPGAVRA
ncbi:TetR family transcriptional regulator OS=Streptomyces tendae OX=1932 GN=GUR47_23215 PE=4 SV=1 [Streptomyces tendae]